MVFTVLLIGPTTTLAVLGLLSGHAELKAEPALGLLGTGPLSVPLGFCLSYVCFW